MKEGLPTHHFVLCLLSYPSYPRWQAGYAVRANWEVSVGHGSISKIEMYACRLCVPPPPQWRSIAAPPPLCGVWILGGVRTFASTLDVFYETTWKPVGLTVDKDNLEPCLLIQNAKYSILKPSLSAPPSKHFVYDLLFGACPDIYVSYVLYPMISFGRSLTYPILKYSIPRYSILFISQISNFKANLSGSKMVFCYQNCSDLLWEKIVLVIEKNVWNSRLKAENLQNF